MTFREFLEKSPLYSQKKIDSLLSLSVRPQISAPSIFTIVQPSKYPSLLMHCNHCKEKTTFTTNDTMFRDGLTIPKDKAFSDYVSFSYTCQVCNVINQKYFLIYYISRKDNELNLNLVKVGQYPELQIPDETDMRELLDKKDFEVYKKGFRCEGSSFGIGAYAYYRQLVEDKIDFILDKVEANGDEEIKTLVASARSEKNTTRKIEIIKDHIPEKLKSGGHNPLSLLHSLLSEGLHDGTDEECLDRAEKIRVALLILLKNIRKQDDEHEEIQKVFGDLAKGKK